MGANTNPTFVKNIFFYKRLFLLSSIYLFFAAMVLYIPFYYYFLPRYAVHKASKNKDIYQSCLYLKKHLSTKRGFYVSIDNKDFFTNEITISFVANELPINKKKIEFRKMEIGKCYKVKYITLFEIEFLSYKKIYLYDYLE